MAQARGVKVEKVDQDKINLFSRLNMYVNELKQDKKKKKDELEAIEDSLQLIEESFGEKLMLALGELMIDVDEDTARDHHEKILEQKKDELDKIDD